ncbi:hypothetical protein GC170_04300 [bacterium]|nr:hypothetical protein [bacterium]
MRLKRCHFRTIRFFFLLALNPIWDIAARADEKATLRERVDPNRIVASTHAMSAEGTFFLDPPADSAKSGKADSIKPESLKVIARTKLMVQDRWRVGETAGGSTTNGLVSLRVVSAAESEIGGELRPSKTSLRAQRKRMVVDIENEAFRTVCVDGPLTRSELEALTTPGDAASLWTLLPKTGVEQGETYRLDRIAAKSLTLYDAIAVNGLEGKIQELTEKSVKIAISGEVRGAVLGAEGVMKLRGELTFDRESGLVTFLKVDREESRRPGSVEAGLEITSRLEVRRQLAAEPVAELTGDLAAWPGTVTPQAAVLEWFDPTGTIRLEHDRDWHVTWSDTEESVLKRVDRGGAVIAQCNVKKAPMVAPGQHQDPEQFEQDVQEALGKQFRKVFGKGELQRPEGQGYGFKLAIEGIIQELPVVWYYYLMASPQGDQFVATVTTTLAETLGSGKPGLLLAESLRWSDRAAKKEDPKR